MRVRLDTACGAKAPDDMAKNFEPLFHTGDKFSDETRAYTAMRSGLTVVIFALASIGQITLEMEFLVVLLLAPNFDLVQDLGDCKAAISTG